ncbi:sporulation membrane protein YtaF [Thalassobacillus hwangdonensis]|uniref:Sporulation membrane protein YtaF n=1 Tax=Thalassobacillus hwangdonensis TaxID=546108 RepID=A0ABW3L1D1_9BACI
MGVYATIVLLVTAVSLDSLGLGFIYGLKKIALPKMALLLIACLSSAIFYLSVSLGSMLTRYLSEHIAERIGAIILIGLGLWFFAQLFKPAERNHKEKKEASWSTPSDILKSPELADMDDSGSIKGWEAVLLALALSFDTVGAGVSAAFLNIPPLFTSIAIGFMTSFLLFGGMKIGGRVGRSEWMDKASVLPAILLILIGIFKLV